MFSITNQIKKTILLYSTEIVLDKVEQIFFYLMSQFSNYIKVIIYIPKAFILSVVNNYNPLSILLTIHFKKTEITPRSYLTIHIVFIITLINL